MIIRTVGLTSCLLLALTARPLALQAADAAFFDVTKGTEYTQTGSGVPTLNGTNGWAFEAEVLMSANNSVTNAVVQSPAAVPPYPLTLSASQSKRTYKHKYNTVTKLNANDPSGAYLMTMQGVHDGTRQASLQLAGDVYPAGPYIQNFPSTQTINANGYCLVTWGQFPGGASADIIQFRVQDLLGNKIFETPDPGKPGAFDGTAIRVLIAPGILSPGQTSQATLLFQKTVGINQTSYPEALGEAGYFARTTFYPITTTAVAPDVKTFEIDKASKWIQTDTNSLALETGQQFEFEATIQAYATGALTTATVLVPSNTNSLSRSLVLQPGGTTLYFSDIAPTAGGLDAFYGAGVYTLVFDTAHDSNKSLALSLPADAYPPAPRISNFNVVQTINVNHDTLVSWDPWSGGGVGDFVQLRIEDHNFNKLYETPDLGKPGALDGRATNAIVAAGTLPAGIGAEIHVTFTKINAINTTNYPGVLGLSDFQTRTKFNIQLVSGDVQTYSIFKELAFTQTSSGPPAPDASAPFGFDCEVQGTGSNTVLSASVTTPLAAIEPLSAQPGGQAFDFSEPLPTQAALDQTFPSGTYSVTINGATDGPRDLPLTLPADAYPNAPQVTDWYSAQLVDSGSDFVLTWNPFAGAIGVDFIQLLVTNAAGLLAYETPGYGMAGALNGLTSSTAIPAGTLLPNQFYLAWLSFNKVMTIDTITYPGALGLGSYRSSTRFRLITTGPGEPPSLVLAASSSNNQYQLSAAAVPGLVYRIDGSSNLVDWTPLNTNAPSGNLLQWLDPTPRGSFFYRAIVIGP